MSIRSDTAKLEQILSCITDISEIINRHGEIVDTLNDMEGKYAVMLCLSQIGELLGKIESNDIAAKLPVRPAIGLRNIITHNYDGIDLVIVENTIRNQIPELKDLNVSILGDI